MMPSATNSAIISALAKNHKFFPPPLI